MKYRLALTENSTLVDTVFKHTLGQVTLSRKESTVSLLRGVSAAFGEPAMPRLCQFSSSERQTQLFLIVYLLLCVVR